MVRQDRASTRALRASNASSRSSQSQRQKGAMEDSRVRPSLAWWFDQALGKPPFSYQETILRHPGPLVINKARQTGISTTMACMAVSYAALGDKKVLICSNKEY